MYCIPVCREGRGVLCTCRVKVCTMYLCAEGEGVYYVPVCRVKVCTTWAQRVKVCTLSLLVDS